MTSGYDRNWLLADPLPTRYFRSRSSQRRLQAARLSRALYYAIIAQSQAWLNSKDGPLVAVDFKDLRLGSANLVREWWQMEAPSAISSSVSSSHSLNAVSHLLLFDLLATATQSS